MPDLYLRAESEEALADALPMFRGTDADGQPIWVTGDTHYALDVGFPVEITPAEMNEQGDVVKQAVLADGFHANLRLLCEHPRCHEILELVAPFAITPVSPQRQFGGEEPTEHVPEIISDRQFAQALAMRGEISKGEALGWAARGDLPYKMVQALQAIPEENGQRFGAEMLLSSAKEYERSHPLVGALGAMLGFDSNALDDLWRQAAALR